MCLKCLSSILHTIFSLQMILAPLNAAQVTSSLKINADKKKDPDLSTDFLRKNTDKFLNYLQYFKNWIEKQPKSSILTYYQDILKKAENKTQEFEEACKKHDSLIIQSKMGKAQFRVEAQQIAKETIQSISSLYTNLQNIIQEQEKKSPQLDHTPTLYDTPQDIAATQTIVGELPPSAKLPPPSSSRFVLMNDSICENVSYSTLSTRDKALEEELNQ